MSFIETFIYTPALFGWSTKLTWRCLDRFWGKGGWGQSSHCHRFNKWDNAHEKCTVLLVTLFFQVIKKNSTDIYIFLNLPNIFSCQIAFRKSVIWNRFFMMLHLILFFFIYLSNWTRWRKQWQAGDGDRGGRCPGLSGMISSGSAPQSPVFCVEGGERVQVWCRFTFCIL